MTTSSIATIGRGHQAGHVHLIDAVRDVVERVHHRVHQGVRRDERERGHEAKVSIVVSFISIPCAQLEPLSAARPKSHRRRFRVGQLQ